MQNCSWSSCSKLNHNNPDGFASKTSAKISVNQEQISVEIFLRLLENCFKFQFTYGYKLNSVFEQLIEQRHASNIYIIVSSET